jgi:dipeptidase E
LVTKRTIFALGGGGFSMEPENPTLDLFLLSLSLKPKPKILFLGQASGDAKEYAERFYQCYQKLNCIPSHLSLFRPPKESLEEIIFSQDIIFVGGGNTFNMLTLWQAWGLDHILYEAYQRGIILSGISAGAICWFEQGLTDSFGEGYEALNCLGFLEGSCCPHYDGEADRQDRYQELISSSKMPEGLALDDGAAALFINEKFERLVTSSPNKKIHHIKKGTY